MNAIYPETFTFHEDPGHGWIEVPLPILLDLDITELVSCYSYINDGTAYLEEDLDASIFIQAFKHKFGHRPETVDVYEDPTPIRNMRSFPEAPGWNRDKAYKVARGDWT